MNLNLKEIKERAERATSGPWISQTYHILTPLPAEYTRPEICSMGAHNCMGPMGIKTDPLREWLDNINFIACARSDIPALINAVEKLTEALRFYGVAARYEWSSHGGLLGESLIQDNGDKARAVLKELGLE